MKCKTAKELDRIGLDWQAHCQIAARLWSVLYGNFSMISCPNPTLGKLGSWVCADIDAFNSSQESFMLKPT
jgi:hypothetical protein